MGAGSRAHTSPHHKVAFEGLFPAGVTRLETIL